MPPLNVNSFSFVQLKFGGLIIDRLPDGQIKCTARKIKVHPLPEKYSGFPKWQINSILTPSRPTRGAYRDRHERGRDAVDADSASDEGA
jgi:hypothetical protein